MKKDDTPLKTKMSIATVCKACNQKCKTRLSYGDVFYCPNFVKDKDSDGGTKS